MTPTSRSDIMTTREHAGPARRPKLSARRALNSLLLAGVATLALSFGVRAQERINVATYTGVWNDAQKSCVLDPFTKETGIQAIANPGLSSVTLTQLRQQKGKSEFDAVWIDGGFSEQAWAEGLLDPIDLEKVPNAKKLLPQGLFKSKDGQVFALETGFYAAGILYNTTEVKQKPTSWWDLWKPEYAERVIFPSPAQAIFIPILLHLNKLLGGTDANLEPVFQKFRTLKASAYYDSSGTVQSSLQSGEAIIGAYYITSAWSLTDIGMPIAAAVPKEGVPAGDTRLQLPKGSQHRAAAERFLDFAMRRTSLQCLSEKLYLGPPLANPELSEKARARMPWGPDGNIDSLVLPPWDTINARRSEIVNMWNRQVLNR
jgi:putative spermidine/putrescine transport system substrate-binding protein